MAKAATTPPEKIPALCQEILARQNTSKTAMADAGRLLFWGELMGQPCVKADAVRGVQLVQQAGDTVTSNAFIRTLRDRARSGSPLAISALEKLHLKP